MVGDAEEMSLFIGLELRTGKEVRIPIFHTLNTGQTQLSGKCLTGDDLVWCADGRNMTVRQLYESHEQPKVLSINDQWKLEEDHIVSVEMNGIRQVYSVAVADGSSVKLSANHPLLTPKGWRPVSGLKKGDWVALPRHLPINTIKNAPDSVLKIIAYMLTEGTLVGNKRFTNADLRLVAELDNALREHGLQLKHVGKYDYNIVQIIPHKRPSRGMGVWRLFCEKYGLALVDSNQKAVPSFMFELDNIQLATFLNRCFAGDGTAYMKKSGDYIRPMIGFCSMSYQFLLDVKQLLLRFGIKTRICKHRELYISHADDMLRFIEQIGIKGKEGMIEDIKNFIMSRQNLRVLERIPVKVPNYRKHFSGNGYSPEKYYIDGFRSNINRQVLNKTARLSGNSYLLQLSQNDIWWMKIAQITLIGKEETFDVQVERNGNLVVNGILVHNTTLMKTLAKQAVEQGYKILVFDTKQTLADFETFGQEIPICLRETTDSLTILGLLESIMGRKLTMQYATLSRVSENAATFKDVLHNAEELEEKAHSGFIKDAARVLIDLMERLIEQTEGRETTPKLELKYPINRITMNKFSLEGQQMIVKTALEDALDYEKLIIMLDEASKFLPQKYRSACQRAINHFVTQGAATGDFLWMTTQFLATTSKDAMKAMDIKILGRQSHDTECQHTLDLIPKTGDQKFTQDSVMQLKLGHFIVVAENWVKVVYTVPENADKRECLEVALGKREPKNIHYRYTGLLTAEDLRKIDKEKRKTEVIRIEAPEKKVQKIEPQKVAPIIARKEEKPKEEPKKEQLKKLLRPPYSGKPPQFQPWNERFELLENNLEAVRTRVVDIEKIVNGIHQFVPLNQNITLEQGHTQIHVERAIKQVKVSDETNRGKIITLAQEGFFKVYHPLREVVKALEDHHWTVNSNSIKLELYTLTKEQILGQITENKEYKYILAPNVHFA